MRRGAASSCEICLSPCRKTAIPNRIGSRRLFHLNTRFVDLWYQILPRWPLFAHSDAKCQKIEHNIYIMGGIRSRGGWCVAREALAFEARTLAGLSRQVFSSVASLAPLVQSCTIWWTVWYGMPHPGACPHPAPTVFPRGARPRRKVTFPQPNVPSVSIQSHVNDSLVLHSEALLLGTSQNRGVSQTRESPRTPCIPETYGEWGPLYRPPPPSRLNLPSSFGEYSDVWGR